MLSWRIKNLERKLANKTRQHPHRTTWHSLHNWEVFYWLLVIIDLHFASMACLYMFICISIEIYCHFSWVPLLILSRMRSSINCFQISWCRSFAWTSGDRMLSFYCEVYFCLVQVVLLIQELICCICNVLILLLNCLFVFFINDLVVLKLEVIGLFLSGPKECLVAFLLMDMVSWTCGEACSIPFLNNCSFFS
jgi:hypothetical protein